VLVGLAVRVVLLVAFHHGTLLENSIVGPTDDQLEYMGLAHNLLAGKGYVLYQHAYGAPGPYIYRPPGYPVFLAATFKLTGGHYGLLRAVQIFATVGFVPLLMIGLRRLQAHWLVVLAGGLFAAINPFLVYHSMEIMSDWLFNLLFMGAVVAYLHMLQTPQDKRPALIAGLLLACATLTRGEGWYFTWILLGVALLMRRRAALRPCAWALAAFLPLMTVWTVRNWVTFHAFIPTQRGTMARSILDSHRSAYSGYEWPGYTDWRAQVLDREARLPVAERDEFEMTELKRHFREQPLHLARSCLSKLRLFYALVPRTLNPDDSTGLTPYQGSFYTITSLAGYAAFLPFFFVGAFVLCRKERTIAVALLGVVAMNGIIGMIANPNIRIRTEMQALLLLFACVGLDALWRRWLASRQQMLAAPC
jgi:4-amino-4-deoxy-L-arabinose transferase-like glycosyltransferase